MSLLFTPLTLRNTTFRNRAWVSPMCQYSSDNGLPTDWHVVHLGSRAVGGAGMVIVEASGVSADGRITPWDSGLWSPDHARAFSRITRFIRDHGAVPAIQLAHAGRKASTDRPWNGGKKLDPSQGGWQVLAPSPIPFSHDYPQPREMTLADIDQLVDQFTAAARYAIEAGFDVIEIHAAHGYLLHQFLSPLSNQRPDDYGGSLDNRMRLPLRIAEAVRKTFPADRPVLVRISATDWADGGWDLPQSIEFCRRLRSIGIDLIDCSSGGLVPGARIELRPGYQVPFAHAIRQQAGIPTGAVGLITEPEQAEQILSTGQADAILLARAMLRDPYWPLHAARKLGDTIPWPIQYDRARD